MDQVSWRMTMIDEIDFFLVKKYRFSKILILLLFWKISTDFPCVRGMRLENGSICYCFNFAKILIKLKMIFNKFNEIIENSIKRMKLLRFSIPNILI